MSQSLKTQLMEHVKAAMRAKDSARLGTLRLLQAAIKQKEVDDRTELDDIQIVAIIEKQIKQRRESILAFQQAGRTETAEQEQAELLVLQEFLPEQASAEEVDAAIAAALESVAGQGITGAPAMGKVMGMLKKSLSGKADMSVVSAQVKARLGA